MMDKKNIILVAILVLVIVLLAFGIYLFTTNSHEPVNVNATVNNTTQNNTPSQAIMIDKEGKPINDTVVGDDSPRNDTDTSNETYRVYNPQSDSYVTVIGEGYDAEVDRWYTFDTDGVRYYNTRIK